MIAIMIALFLRAKTAFSFLLYVAFFETSLKMTAILRNLAEFKPDDA